MKKVQILECTLRDGSYAIDFQFNAEDTSIIAAGLEDCGFKLIEIGHGLGLNASNAGEGVAAATDEEYLHAASSTLKKAKFGMFFIPGIGRKEDLKLAADYGMGFVRIGTNAPEIKKAEEYIKLAKKLDMEVSSNLMKSYALKPKELAECGKLAEKWGADVVAIVDSAGGMLPKEIKEYVRVMEDSINAEIGFHGHNNLSLVHANCLAAVEAGATRIDSSLQGMGRSAGNAQTETLAALLEKTGYDLGIDLKKTMDLGKEFIKPLTRKRGTDPIELTLGYAKFHSKFLKNIYKASEKHNVDPRELIIRSSEKTVVNVPEELAMTLAQELSEEKKRIKTHGVIESERRIYIKENKAEESLGDSAKRIALELLSLSKKTGKESIFTISGRVGNAHKEAVFPFIRENFTNVIGNAEVRNITQGVEIARAIDGIVDTIMIDADQKRDNLKHLQCSIKRKVKKSKVLTYKDSDAWVAATSALLSQLREVAGLKVVILGANTLSSKFALNLNERGAKIRIWDDDPEYVRKFVGGLNVIKPEYTPKITMEENKELTFKGAEVLINFIPRKAMITPQILKKMNRGGLVIDAGIGTIDPKAIKIARDRGLELYRLDMRAGLSGEIITALETSKLVESIIGTKNMGGVTVVAGGFVGEKGDVIVDSIINPTRVIGIADGKGGLLQDEKNYQDKMEKIKRTIMRRTLYAMK